MIDNRDRITVTTSKILWPMAMQLIVAGLFQVKEYEVSFETECNADSLMLTAEWGSEQTVGVFFTISKDGTEISIIDGCDNDFKPTIKDIQALHDSLLELI